MQMRRIMLAGLIAISISSCGVGGSEAEKSAQEPMRFPVQEMMDKLIQSLDTWMGLNRAEKEKAIEVAIALFRERENSAIINQPSFYADKMDEALNQTPAMSRLDLPTMLKILAVMEYDFYNGQNKDDLAREVLGEKMYEENKQRREQAQP